MLRGFRWQLLALLGAVVLFSVVLLTRSNGGAVPLTAPVQAEQSSPTADAVVAQAEPTSLPGNDDGVEIEVLPTPTPREDFPEPAGFTEASDGITTYREALVGRVQRLNPLFADLNSVDRDITSLIFEGLVKLNAYGEPVGALAEEWVISSDGLEYVFILRDDVLWQDGTPFTAADVVYTMEILRSQDFPGSNALSSFWRTVETEALNDHLVRFRLAQPLGSFLEALRIGILPYHALQGTRAAQLASHPFNLSPIGTGPYQLESLGSLSGDRIDVVDLRVAPVYRMREEGQGENTFALERMRFHLFDNFEQALNAFSGGEVDGLAGQTRDERRALLELVRSGTVEIRNTVEPALGALIFNWKDDSFPIFREQRVRLALMIGLNRSSFIERNLINLAIRADSPMLFGSWAYTPGLPWPEPNVGRAREYLETARIQLPEPEQPEVPEGEEGTAVETVPTPESEAAENERDVLFSMSILTPDDPSLVAVAQEIASQWSQLRIDVSVEAVDLTTYRQRLEAGQFQAAIVELSKEGSADPDMYDFWHEGQHPDDDPKGRNYGGVNDRDISELLEKARREPNGLNRTEDYRRFQQIFIERAIAIPLYYPIFTYAIRSNIEDVQLAYLGSVADRFMTIKEWELR
jgi:peptide/nickel transport system substrate-binding protein